MKTQDRSVVHTTMALGTNQHLTPEGFLLCRDVPIARIGHQQYLNEELAPEIEGGADGVIHVERRPEDVFHDDVLASFEGKPVIDEHPESGDLLNPETVRQHWVGTTLNVRRGSGAMEDFIVADLLIMGKEAIAAVRAGKREVSCGYDAAYEQIAPGRARQHKIIGNHVALVPRGRCGPRCAIGDEDMTVKKNWLDRALDCMKGGDKAGFRDAMEEGEKEIDKKKTDDEGLKETPTGVSIHFHGMASTGPASQAGTVVSDEKEDEEEDKKTKDEEVPGWFTAHVASNNQRFDSIERALAKMTGGSVVDKKPDDEDEEVDEEGEEESSGSVVDKKMKDGDDEDDEDEETMDAEGEKEDDKKKETGDKKAKDKKKSMDSLPLSNDFREVVAGAEILSPGIKLFTFDAAAPRKTTADQMCVLKRRALKQHSSTADGAKALARLTGKKNEAFTTKGMDCLSVDTLFRGAVGLAEARNSRGTVDRGVDVQKKAGPFNTPTSVSDLNSQIRKHYNQQ